MNTLKTALIYSFSRKNAQRTTSVIIILGIALSMAAIIVIGAVVDALQSRQLDVLRTVESFDLIVESTLSNEEISSISGVSEAFEFGETTCVVTIPETNSNTALRIRAVDFDSYFSSKRIMGELFLSKIKDESEGIVVSMTLLSKSGIQKNTRLMTTFLRRGKTATVSPYSKNLVLDGSYYCTEPTFLSTTAFIDLSTYKSVLGDSDIKTGVFINGNQNEVVSEIIAKDNNAVITTWQEYNKATYSALMLEKILIYIFMGFMFVILCTNLKNSTSRLIRNRQWEGAVLRALGCTSSKVTSIFICQGLILSFIGEVAGTLIGYLAVSNISLLLGLGGALGYSISAAILSVEFSPETAALLFVCVFVFSYLFVRRGCRTLYRNEIMEVLLNDTY